MKCLVAMLVLLAVAAAGAFGGVRFFSKLSGVDMQAVISWSVGAKKFPFVLIAGFFYLVAFACLVALLDKPATLIAMNATHEGALLGYTDSAGPKLYDPASREYRPAEKHYYVQAAPRFTDAFGVVAFYRLPRFDWWEDVDAPATRWWTGIVVLFAVCLIFFALYALLFKLAQLYINDTGLNIELSHRAILDNFLRTARVSLPIVASTAVLLVLIPWLLSGYMVHRILDGYQEQYGHIQKELRSELLANVAPGKKLAGRVVGRGIGYEQELATSVEYSRSNMISRWKSVSVLIYTIEFPGLIRRTPVYLSITRRNSDSDPVAKALEELLPPEAKRAFGKAGGETRSAGQEKARTAEFVVNEDFSVSLAQEKKP